MSWKLYEWTGLNPEPTALSTKEIEHHIQYLRNNHYPKPDDCLDSKCPGYRPACRLGICYVAIKLCNDF